MNDFLFCSKCYSSKHTNQECKSNVQSLSELTTELKDVFKANHDFLESYIAENYPDEDEFGHTDSHENNITDIKDISSKLVFDDYMNSINPFLKQFLERINPKESSLVVRFWTIIKNVKLLQNFPNNKDLIAIPFGSSLSNTFLDYSDVNIYVHTNKLPQIDKFLKKFPKLVKRSAVTYSKHCIHYFDGETKKEINIYGKDSQVNLNEYLRSIQKVQKIPQYRNAVVLLKFLFAKATKDFHENTSNPQINPPYMAFIENVVTLAASGKFVSNANSLSQLFILSLFVISKQLVTFPNLKMNSPKMQALTQYAATFLKILKTSKKDEFFNMLMSNTQINDIKQLLLPESENAEEETDTEEEESDNDNINEINYENGSETKSSKKSDKTVKKNQRKKKKNELGKQKSFMNSIDKSNITNSSQDEKILNIAENSNICNFIIANDDYLYIVKLLNRKAMKNINTMVTAVFKADQHSLCLLSKRSKVLHCRLNIDSEAEARNVCNQFSANIYAGKEYQRLRNESEEIDDFEIIQPEKKRR